MTPPEDANEARFLERLRARDEHAFNELVRLYERRVFAIVLRMLGGRRDEAEDTAQEVFVQVFKAVGQFRGDSKLSTWIYRVAVNLCKNRLKYLSRRHDGAHDALDGAHEVSTFDHARGSTLGEAARPDEMVSGMQMEVLVQRAISQLEPDFREVLVLRDVEDMSYEQIGEITGLPDGTVKSRIHRARGQLREIVEAALGERIP